MKNILVIRNGRILLQESVQQQNLLTLKICVGRTIHKFNDLTWSQPCHRWQTPQEIKIGYHNGSPIELELYYPSKSIPKVLGEATIDMAIFSRHLEEELKIALTYNGIIKGWLYCQIGFQGQGPVKIDSRYLYIHKLSFHFLKDYQKEFSLSIYQNTQPIYQKKFVLSQTSKTLFPNIKNSIKYSDVVRITLINADSQFKAIYFLVDNIKRGKTSQYQTWLRNKFNNKAGDLQVQYFLENLFLENDRKVMSRKAFFPKTLSRASSTLMNSEQLTNKLKVEQKIEEVSQNESTSLTSQDLNKTGKKLFEINKKDKKTSTTEILEKKNENAMPCLKKKATISSNKIGKKEDFYFQHPFD